VGGKWYVLVAVDDYSRYAWVFFLEDKSETFGFVVIWVLSISIRPLMCLLKMES
jgi:hypothetical protein